MNRISNLQTIYQYGGDLYEKNKILLKPSSNCKVVRVKSNRVCADCGALIDKGSSCYTFNPRGRGRRWVCFSCLPEPNVEKTQRVGEIQGCGVDTQLVFYSEATDSFGRHKTMNELEPEEVSEFYDRREGAIWASMPDDF